MSLSEQEEERSEFIFRDANIRQETFDQAAPSFRIHDSFCPGSYLHKYVFIDRFLLTHASNLI